MRAFDLSRSSAPQSVSTGWPGCSSRCRARRRLPIRPYNIQKLGENAYRVTLAVAGFGDDEIAIEVKENLLTVSGKLAKENGANEAYLHRGIAARAFERRFNLADHIQVTGAALDKGLLHIDLVRELPESAEGAPDRHRRRRPEAARPQGVVTGRGRGIASRPRQESGARAEGLAPLCYWRRIRINAYTLKNIYLQMAVGVSPC